MVLETPKVIIKEIEYTSTYAIRQAVMWPDRDLEYIKLESDPDGLHFGAFVDDKLVAVISLFVNVSKSESDLPKNQEIETQKIEAQYRKFAALKSHQGQGIGSQLLNHVIRTSSELGVKRLWCNARLNATNLYERHGLKKN